MDARPCRCGYGAQARPQPPCRDPCSRASTSVGLLQCWVGPGLLEPFQCPLSEERQNRITHGTPRHVIPPFQEALMVKDADFFFYDDFSKVNSTSILSSSADFNTSLQKQTEKEKAKAFLPLPFKNAFQDKFYVSLIERRQPPLEGTSLPSLIQPLGNKEPAACVGHQARCK